MVNVPGISINPLEDTVTEEYIHILKTLSPKYLRYPEGEISQNYWATAPSWDPSTARYINKGVWPANDTRFVKDGKPKMFNLRVFLELCENLDAIPIIIVPVNSMYGKWKTPYNDILSNAVKLVEYIGNRDVIYEIGNETTLGKSPSGNTDILTFAKDAGRIINGMVKVNPKAKCIVGGKSSTEWTWVSRIPGIFGIVAHNYPGHSVDKWLARDGIFLVKNLEECKVAIGKKEMFITETSATNFTDQPNDVGMALMTADLLLNSMQFSECVVLWTTKWSVGEIKPSSAYSLLHPSNDLTCTGVVCMLISLAVYVIGDDCKITKETPTKFKFSGNGKTSYAIINKSNKPEKVNTKKAHYSMYGSLKSTTPGYSVNTQVMEPYSLKRVYLIYDMTILSIIYRLSLLSIYMYIDKMSFDHGRVAVRHSWKT